ncbi:MAG: hypothetical protein AB1896_06635 [Thermodesulfobacteriota bacterium]
MSRVRRPAAVIIFLAVLVLVVPVPGYGGPAEEKKHDEGFHFYIALGGCVAAGFYFFIAYSSGLVDYDPVTRSALINYGPDGWRPGVPVLNMVQEGAAAGDYYLELLTIRY